VLVIDADLGLANVEIVFGLKPRYHMGDLINSSISIEDVMIEAPHGVKILPAGSGVQSLTQLSAEDKLRFIAALEPVQDKFDLVLVDSGAGIGDNVLFFVGAAQEAILVVSPEPTSLVDAYATVKVLSQKAGRAPLRGDHQPGHRRAAGAGDLQQAHPGHQPLPLGQRPPPGLHPPRREPAPGHHGPAPAGRRLPHSPASRALNVLADKLFNESARRSSTAA
jgi:flagellar biosynthesis protein FlhG